MPQTPLTYALNHRSEFITQLKDWLTIPSISSQPAYAAEMTRAADWTANHMRQMGLENVAVLATAGHPAVYGDWLHAEGAPTVLIYGHYDVQPVKPEEWTSPAFVPTERDGKLYARGAADDKGQTFLHLKAVEAYLKTRGKLPINVKFLVEGEEEVGSRTLVPLLERETERFKADTVLISDTPWVGPGVPTIHVGLRGGCGMNIEIHGPANDLHSGLFGGAVQNPIHAAAQIIARLHDAKGRVTVPGFYDTVRPLSRAERNQTRRIPISDAEILAETGAPRLWGEAGYSAMERMGARPTLDILEFVGGGAAAAVTSTVRIRLACRLVPDQDPEDIYQRVHDHVLALAPDTVRVTIKKTGPGGPGTVFPPDAPGIKAAQTALRQTFGVKPVFARSGGGIPVVRMFMRTLGLPSLLMGFGLPDDGLHGPNEKMDLEQFYGGIDTSIRFMQAYGREGVVKGDA